MKLGAKKIIAREFLILLLSAMVSVFAFLIIYPYNSFRKFQINKLSKEIQINQHEYDSLSSQFKAKKEKQLAFHDELYDFIYTYNHPKKIRNKNEDDFDVAFRESVEVIKYKEKNGPIFQGNGNLLEFDTTLNYFLKNNITEFDLLKNFPAFGEHFGFSTPEKFKEFIKKYTVNADDTAKNKEATKINDMTNLLGKGKADLSKKIFSFNQQLHFAFIAFLIVAFILFPIRYIYYSFKWSLNVLQQKD